LWALPGARRNARSQGQPGLLPRCFSPPPGLFQLKAGSFCWHAQLELHFPTFKIWVCPTTVGHIIELSIHVFLVSASPLQFESEEAPKIARVIQGLCLSVNPHFHARLLSNIKDEDLYGEALLFMTCFWLKSAALRVGIEEITELVESVVGTVLTLFHSKKGTNSPSSLSLCSLWSGLPPLKCRYNGRVPKFLACLLCVV